MLQLQALEAASELIANEFGMDAMLQLIGDVHSIGMHQSILMSVGTRSGQAAAQLLDHECCPRTVSDFGPGCILPC